MRVQTTKVDHLVIGAANLEQGVEFVRDCLGVDIPYGGFHKKMGTHNHLMRLGDGVFLEVISINYEIKAPDRPRWFGLDDAYVRQLIEMQPALLTWVVNTRNLHELIQQAKFAIGKPELIKRGGVEWHFGLPEDGRLLAGGILPYAIEWHARKHPSSKMVDLGCKLKSLDIYHSNVDWLESVLDSIGARSLVKIHALPCNETPYLKAQIDTPHGVRVLSNCIF